MIDTIELTECIRHGKKSKPSVWGAGEPIDIGITIELTNLVLVKKFPSDTTGQALRRSRRAKNMSNQDRRDSAQYRRLLSKRECFYCGQFKNKMEIEHYFPLAKGGTDHTWNLYSACRNCNMQKGIQCGTRFLLRMGVVTPK